MENIDYSQENKLKYHSTKDKPDIKIYVSQRIDQTSKIITNNPLFVNMRCGAIYDKRSPEEYNYILGDDTGDNISSKRKILNEYTVMYWAWKNSNADYIGLCHYRRFLNFSSTIYGKEFQDSICQVLIDSMADVNLQKCGLLDENKMRTEIQSYDIIANQSYNWIKGVPDNCKNIREAWETRVPQYLRTEEFYILLEAIKKYAPEYYKDAKEYMSGKEFRGFNCFVMKKEYFNNLCEFMFPILFYLEKKFDSKNKSYTQNRAPAYAGEWLYSIWIYHVKKKKALKFKECQLFAFQNTEPIETLYPSTPNSIPIVIAGRGVCRLDVSVTIQSILVNRANEATPIDIIILQQSSSSDRWQNNVRNIENDKIRQQVGTFKNATVRFFDPKDYISQFEWHQYSKINNEETCYKLMLPWILEKYSKIIYLENNVFLKSDILNFWNIDLENKVVAATKNFFAIGKFNGYHKFSASNINSCIKDMDILMNYLSTDMLIMDLNKIRQRYSCDDMYNEYVRVIQSSDDKNEEFNTISEKNIDNTFNILFHNLTKILPQQYNKTLVSSAEYYHFLEFVPDDLILSDKTSIYAYSLRSIDVPICYGNLSISNELMQTMKSTPFYEQFIQASVVPVSLIELQILKDKFMYYFLKLIPYKSYRWKILKKILK